MKRLWLLFALCLGIVPSAQAQLTWTQQCAPGPQSGYYGQIAYDSAHNQIVFFGGVPDPSNPAYPNDTWTWDGTVWTKQSPATKPPGRAGFGMAYDSARGRVVIFGGSSANGFLNDTWEWDGANWAQKANGPGFLLHVGMAYDAARQQTVLYGGSVGSPFPLANTWVWDGNAWTQKFPATNPGPRSNFRMAYDAGRQQIVMFGGWNGSMEVNETWVWDGANWMPRFPANPPSPRQDFGIAYDSNRQRIVLFSGILPPSNPVDNNTYEWDGGNWTPDTPAQNPLGSGRAGVSMAYDSSHSQVVMFGGANTAQIFTDTWVFGAAGSSSLSFAGVVQNRILNLQNIGPVISGNFQPNCGLPLKQAVKLLGDEYDHFNWKQVVMRDDLVVDFPEVALAKGDYDEVNSVPLPLGCDSILEVSTGLCTGRVPYTDPPLGGYDYQVAGIPGLSCSEINDRTCQFPVEDNLPWYWDEQFDTDFNQKRPTNLEQNSDSSTLQFVDMPSSDCLNLISEVCITVSFRTSLVAVKSDGSGTVIGLPGTQFEWSSRGNVVGVPHILSNTNLNLASGVVTFEGFVPPGSFTSEILNLYAREGIDVFLPTGLLRPVMIDIKPGGLPNSINPRSNGKIPVAIISTVGFQAPIQVDQSSLMFGHTGNEQSLAFCHAEDVNGDGILDLVCQFYAPLTGFQSGDTAGVLKGKTVSGTPIYGTDSVVIVPSH